MQHCPTVDSHQHTAAESARGLGPGHAGQAAVEHSLINLGVDGVRSSRSNTRKKRSAPRKRRKEKLPESKSEEFSGKLVVSCAGKLLLQLN